MRVSTVTSRIADEINEPASTVAKVLRCLNSILCGQLYRWIRGMV